MLVTGASSGIGRAAAAYLAGQGAIVLLVARREVELKALHEEIAAVDGRSAYRVCDLSDPEQVEDLTRWVIGTYARVDVLINNAGRSMRRPLAQALHRLDDVDRAMAVNFFGPVRLTTGLLRAMLQHGAGHIINVGTWTVPLGTSPRFAAYHSSKAALAGFGRSLDAELAALGVRVTNIHFPLVHTAMSAPTQRFRDLPGLTPDQAARWIAAAVRRRPAAMMPRFVLVLRALAVLSPRLVDRVLMRWG